ncbi:hypothetical protein [Niallia sp. 01092]|uniref:hypothetical protein n=1 Tax=unclassified Niallia TaxID=2837522 RepID=UPI003FD39B04
MGYSKKANNFYNNRKNAGYEYFKGNDGNIRVYQISTNSDSIFIKYGHDSKDIPVIEMVQSGKGHELPNSYVVKINVTPQKKGILGRDTITFGVEPNKNEKGNIEIRMLDYKHTAGSEK